MVCPPVRRDIPPSLESGLFPVHVAANEDGMFCSMAAGLENCTRPLVFTSGSSVRASGNCRLLARQDE